MGETFGGICNASVPGILRRCAAQNDCNPAEGMACIGQSMRGSDAGAPEGMMPAVRCCAKVVKRLRQLSAVCARFRSIPHDSWRNDEKVVACPASGADGLHAGCVCSTAD